MSWEDTESGKRGQEILLKMGERAECIVSLRALLSMITEDQRNASEVTRVVNIMIEDPNFAERLLGEKA